MSPTMHPARQAPRLDAHTHVWELNRRPQPWIDPSTMGVLHRDHPLSDLVPQVRAAGVDGVILVQVLNVAAETDDYLWLGVDPQVRGVVGWADLLGPDLGGALDALLDHPSGTRLVGIRHQALAESDPSGWLRAAADGPAFADLGRRGLAFDLMFRPEHLPDVEHVIRQHSDTVFVLDHAGKAPVLGGWGSPDAKGWAAAMTRLAAADNLVVKLSGLTTVADLERWTVADLEPFVGHLLGRFGPNRLMFGSDWPASLRAGSYRRTVDAMAELTASLGAAERQAVLGGTAVRTYRLRAGAISGSCDA